MKNKILQYFFIIAILSAIAGGYFYFQSTAAQKINSSQTPKLTDGLVGYWTFDGADMTATEAMDVSANNNHGTINGTVPKIIGKIGQGLEFDGSTSYLNAGSPNLGISNYTICTWIYPKAFPASQATFFHYRNTEDSANAGFRILPSGILQIYDENTDPPSFNNALEQLNKWYYVCAVVVPGSPGSSSGNYKYYLNGILDNNANGGHNPSLAEANIMTIGARGSFGQKFTGRLDETRIYNRALSASEITELYQQGQTKINASQTGKLTDGLTWYWTMDGADVNWVTNTVTNKVSGGPNGTLVSMNTSNATIGKIGQALDFDGTADYFTFDSSGMNGAGAISVSAWVNLDSFNPDETGSGIFTRNGSMTASPALFINHTTGNIVFYISTASGNGDGLLTTATAVPLGQWKHIVATWDGTNLYAYIDGTKDANTDTTVGHALRDTTSGRVGYPNTGEDQYFNGKIDEVRVYNKALSQSEITELYQQGQTKINASQTGKLTDGLVGHWTMDGPDINWGANTITNRGTLGGTGSLSGMVQATDPKIGKIGQALNFDGTNNYINNGDILGFDVDDAFSVSFWARFENIGSGRIIGKGWGGCSNTWKIENSTGVAFGFDDENCNQQGVIETSTPNLNTWYHYVATYDGSQSINGLKLYRDTVAGYSQGGSYGLSTSLINSYPMGIGARSATTSFFNKGQLDEVRVYDRELSQSEVTELYNQGR